MHGLSLSFSSSLVVPFERPAVIPLRLTLAMHLQSFFWVFLALVYTTEVHARVTVWSQIPYHQFTKTASAAEVTYTAHAMYDPTDLTPPALPVPPLNTQFSLTLQATSAAQGGLSQAVPGTFWGFSVEMSVANQVCEWLQ